MFTFYFEFLFVTNQAIKAKKLNLKIDYNGTLLVMFGSPRSTVAVLTEWLIQPVSGLPVNNRVHCCDSADLVFQT